MQRAGDARALQGLLWAVFFPRRHQHGHLGLGQRNFLAAKFGERDVLDDVVGKGGLLGGGGHMFFPMSSPDLRVLRKRTAIHFSSCPVRASTRMAGTSPAMTA